MLNNTPLVGTLSAKGVLVVSGDTLSIINTDKSSEYLKLVFRPQIL